MGVRKKERMDPWSPRTCAPLVVHWSSALGTYTQGDPIERKRMRIRTRIRKKMRMKIRMLE